MQLNNINELQPELKNSVTLDSTYFAALADSIPKKVQIVIKSKGKMTKYWLTLYFICNKRRKF